MDNAILEKYGRSSGGESDCELKFSRTRKSDERVKYQLPRKDTR